MRMRHQSHQKKRRQEENRASDSTQRRKAEAKDPGIGRLSGQHYGHYPGNRITIGHRDHCEPAWQTRRGIRGRPGQTAAHSGAGAMHETRATGIRQDSTLHISLKKNRHSDTGIAANQRCETPNCTSSPPEGRASSTTHRNSADARGPCASGPCTGHKSGQHDGHHPVKWTIGQTKPIATPCEDHAMQYHMQSPA